MTGYHAPTAMQAAGITYRQLDYWARTGLVRPTVPADGSGSKRSYATSDVVLLAVVKRLLDIGFTIGAVRQIVADARTQLAELTTQRPEGHTP